MPIPRRGQITGRRAGALPALVPDLAAGLALDAELAGAVCTTPGVDPDAFFPDAGDTAAISAAQQVCMSCPVRAACLAKAVARGERHGVFGGHHFHPHSRITRGHRGLGVRAA